MDNEQQPEPLPVMLPLAQAARTFGPSVQTLKRWLDRGLIDGFRETDTSTIWIYTDSIQRLRERPALDVRFCDLRRMGKS